MATAIREAPAVLDTGVVYRNQKPYLRSIVAYHPSLVLLNEKEFISTFDLGESVESLDYHTVAARSVDGGATWTLEGRLIQNPPPRTTHTIRTSRLRDGILVGFGCYHSRENQEAGLLNRETFGLVPVELFLVRSTDGGRTWGPPQAIQPPICGPCWEICHPIVELKDGRWLAPTATWRGWNGENPSGEQSIVLISDDQGETWPIFGRNFDGRESGLSHFEQSTAELQDGRILSVSWVYDSSSGATLPTEYAFSQNRGEDFSAPMRTGFHAQTCKFIQLFDGRLLCVYRRNDQPGLWCSLARLDGECWTSLGGAVLWQGAESGMTGRNRSAEDLSALKFGHPSLKQVAPDQVLALFWCQEDGVTNIRWFRIRV